ncbi:hypothetical protein ZEAMMB73_Zm00001d021172 [Zea mays]|uniref:Uncharacterized protein n=1 Tax=Zea mays TaxID=4577 RepID=A0A1D6I8R3_MAIZE|nr:hypothetical protein ZEAMMB73_Zm00001d021172 [Zea mays]
MGFLDVVKPKVASAALVDDAAGLEACKVEPDLEESGVAFGAGAAPPPALASKKKRVVGMSSKNLMAERRRRKRLNGRLSMLQSVVPKINKMDWTSILGDTIDYMKELLERIKLLQEEIGQQQQEASGMLSVFYELNPNEMVARNTPRREMSYGGNLMLWNSKKSLDFHSRIIWLGGLSYLMALSYCSAKALVKMHNWKQLLEKDQLQIEQRCECVFQGWKEGMIYFPPTYKYSFNSDCYSGAITFCGLLQSSYICEESRFSDHRPVYNLFMAKVESARHRRSNLTLIMISGAEGIVID